MDMMIREHYFPSSNGKDTVYSKIYEPATTKPLGIVQISHGMAEHIGRYDDFMRYLCGRGFVVCGNDHIGHGNTAEKKEDLGYLAAKNGFDALVTDLHLFTIYMRGRYGDIPYILLGHSMGSFAARLYAAKYGNELSALILSGTGAGKSILPLAAAIKKLLPAGGHKPAPLLDKLAFGNFNHGVMNPKTPFDWLSRDQERVADYITDPLCGFLFTASGFGDLFSGIYRANKQEWIDRIPKELPVFLISGDMDPVGDYGKGVAQVCRTMQQSGMRHVTMRLYAGARHELLNEINRQEVYDDVLNFCCDIAARE